jgi:DNA-binding NtrC family response regulator
MASVNAPRILVVDDDREFQRALVKIFKKTGFKVGAASDVNQASAMFDKTHYAFIVLDLKLPGKSGLELLREIKAKAPEAKVIIVTAFGDTLSRHEALEAGAFDYLNKPVKRKSILEIVSRALDVSKMSLIF